jgi:hypothetical protein
MQEHIESLKRKECEQTKLIDLLQYKERSLNKIKDGIDIENVDLRKMVSRLRSNRLISLRH